jgi:putative ABC transport system substrate-binding protein
MTISRLSLVAMGFVLSTILVALCIAEAQQPARIPRIGYLTGTSAPTIAGPDVNADAFRQGLRDLGYIEGKNIRVEYRHVEAKEDRTKMLVAELMELKVDAIVSPHAPAIFAAKRATQTIPIVIVANQDPVASGMVDSLARPGGNITGVTRLTRELSGKRLEFLKLVPGISRVGVFLDVDSTTARTSFKDYEDGARALKITLQSLEIRSLKPDFEGAFQAAVKDQTSALITLRNALLIDNRNLIAELAVRNRMPLMSEGSVFVEAGSLASYSSSEVDSFRRAAFYVDKILKGAKPSDLPVEQPTKFELVINLKTANQIGLAIPQKVLARADRVIK